MLDVPPNLLNFLEPPPRDLIKQPSLGFMNLFDGRSFDKKFCQVFFGTALFLMKCLHSQSLGCSW